ncbi:intradiol ring-cleavage dioxygenase [Neptunicella sp. SCSIO 80796]|uniref:dioxygenase family protein n=1 Tax=Neptunicella plasticusilytica TaxID=3117012 RepID=UPI003A4D8FB0
MTSQHNSRRKLVKTLGAGIIISPLFGLIGCGGSGTESATNSNSSTDNSSDNTAVTGNSTTWASGGTAAMTENFPDDSLFTTATACTVALTGTQTEGPCYFAVDGEDDISEGQTGLPMMLCLRLIDSQCNPLAGLEIEVWHCDVEGIYSGDTSDSRDSDRFSSGFCTGNDNEALQAKWFRGTQITDNNGRVNFKSCFPGWYSSRSIHIHFRIRNNNNDQLISQFCFTDAFCDEICTTHPDYLNRGTQDTPLSRDTVFGNDYAEYQFDTQQNADGSLLAWKTIQIS